MLRRTFIKGSAAGIGAITGLSGAVLRAVAEPLSGLISGMSPAIEGAAQSDKLAWGQNFAVLKSPWSKPPSQQELLASQDRVLVLNKFFRVGGDKQPAQNTECRVAHDSGALLVVFRCSEKDMASSYANLDENLWSKANWDALRGLPSGAISSWPPYPDEVDFLVQPDRSKSIVYQFAATPQGRYFGCKRVFDSESSVTPDEISIGHSAAAGERIEGFEASITKHDADWIASFRIPWSLLGGKPPVSFGILPMRTRYRDNEFSAPVALDYNEAMPIDLLIEMHLSEPATALETAGSLCKLPSGILRWQAPRDRTYPGPLVRDQIWALQASLAKPTDASNLAERLYLTQRWMDLMILEGFTPLRTGWGLLTEDLTLVFLRQKMNSAFQKAELNKAYKTLDLYLSRMDEMSRWWFADGSPGNMVASAWSPITAVGDLAIRDNLLEIPCQVAGHSIRLKLALPVTGGVRLFGDQQGYWRPTDLLPIHADMAGESCLIKTAEGQILVQRNPFSISFQDKKQAEVLRLEGRDIAFRFGAEGHFIATDLRARLDPAETFYGFGEQYDRFDRNGGVVTLWQTDDTVGLGKGLANATYKALPIFHSSKPYMVFSNSSYRLRADIGNTNPAQYRLTQHGPIFDYYFWPSAPDVALKSYTALTGRPPVPPKWAFEPWMGRGGGAWADGKLKDSLAWSIGELGDAIAEQKAVTNRFAELDIPHSAIYAEGPTALSRELNEFMASRGIRVLGYFRPEIGPARQKQLMPEIRADELPILHCGTEKQTATLEYVDFTNPNAYELCSRALKHSFELGVAGSMVDFGDWTPENARFYDGQSGTEMHNFYCYDYQRVVSEVFREHRGNDVILYARGAAPGTQKWLGQFAGDHPANFAGLRHVLTGALNLCACGYSTWGSDIGGYFGFPQPEVYMRWVQFGCFSPLMRPHGIAPREPWYFSEAAVKNYKFLAWTRENLVDYIYAAAGAAQEAGMPIMRSMPVAFPVNPQLAAAADQYMFGPDLLVAPVVNEGISRNIVFPPGRWINLWNGQAVEGPRTLNVAAPLDTIPVYLKPGALLPVQLNRELRFGESMTSGRMRALVVTIPDKDDLASFTNRTGDAGEVIVKSGSQTCRWTLKRLPEIEAILIYGARPVATIKLDGRDLPRLKANAPTKVGNWYIDSVGNRIVVRLPSSQVETSEPELSIEVLFA